MDIRENLEKFQNNYNIKLIGITVVIIFVLIATVSVAGFVYISDTESSETEEEQYGLYDSVPEESNFVFQLDIIGLVEDQVTRDVSNELHYEYIGEDEDWYDNRLEDYYNETNMLFEEELSVDFDVQIQDINNMMIFSSYDEEDIENIYDIETMPEDEDINSIGYLVDVELNKTEIEQIIEQEDELNDMESIEYNNNEIYYEESEYGEDTYGVILDDGIIAVSNTEPYIESIIDTHHGEQESINKDLIPDNYNETYVSFAMDDVDIIYDELINVMDDLEQDPLYDELSEEEKQDVEEFKELPTPQTLNFNYYTDNVEELHLDTKVTFDTLQAASEANRYFEESDDDIDIDITLDTTSVIINTETTSDIIIESLTKEIDEYEHFINSFNQSPEEDKWDNIPNEVDIDVFEEDDTTRINVIEEGHYEEFHVLNPEGESIGVLNETNDWADIYPILTNNESYTVIGVDRTGFVVTEIHGSYEVSETIIDDLLNEELLADVHIDETDEDIDVTITRTERVDEFYIIDSEGNEQLIGSQVGDNITVPSGEYIIVVIVEDGTEEIIKTINTTEEEFEGYSVSETDDETNNETDDETNNETDDETNNETDDEEDVSSTTTVSKEELNEDEMIKITIEENEFVDEFRVIDPDGISHNMDSEIGNTEEFPSYDDGSYTVIAILEDGSEETIETVEA